MALWAFCSLGYPTPPQLLYGVWALTPAVGMGSAVGSCYLGRRAVVAHVLSASMLCCW